MKYIKLVHDKGRVAVDDEDFFWLLGFNWRLVMSRTIKYASTHVKIGSRWKSVRMHALIMQMHRLLPDGLEVDHINGDGLDNRKSNLRPATRTQNMGNRRKRKPTVSLYKGVYFMSDHFRNRPYRASISLHKKGHCIGYFATAEEAAREYDKAAREYFGEFAKLNFPEEE